MRKLTFLVQNIENTGSVGNQFLSTLLEISDNNSLLQLLEGCSFLEAHLGMEGIVARVKDGSMSLKEIKNELLQFDQTTLLNDS